MDHLLLHCPIVFELWFLMFCSFRLHWVMPHKVIELLSLGKVNSGDIAI